MATLPSNRAFGMFLLALGLVACAERMGAGDVRISDGSDAGGAGPRPDLRLASPRQQSEPDTRLRDLADPDASPGSFDTTAAIDDAVPRSTDADASPAAQDRSGVPRRTIMCIGDSTTTGYDGLATFRFFLWERLTKEAYDLDFVGSQTRNAYRHRDVAGPVVIWPDREHEGHEGLRTGEAAQQIGGWTQSIKPDIALLLVGNNDAGSRSADEIAGNLGKVIDGLRKANGNAAVLLAQLFPGTNGKSRIPAINKRIAELGQMKHTEKNPVIVVDLYDAGYEDKDYCCGGWHLRDSGHKKMTEKWYPALAPLLSKKPAP